MDVEWPDGRREELYSPSTVVEDVFAAGAEYPLAVFVDLTRRAMAEASDRVHARYGFACPRAAATLAAVEASAARFGDDDVVRLAGFRR